MYNLIGEMNSTLLDPKDVKLYVDLDGVLVNFEGGLDKILEEPYNPERFDNDAKYRSMVWKTISKYQENGHNFWEELNPMKDAQQLWDYVADFNPEILTATGLSKYNSGEQKIKWVKENVGSGITVNLVEKSRDKAKFASPKSVLIDDKEKSIDPWREAGGIGILHVSAKDTIQQLKRYGL